MHPLSIQAWLTIFIFFIAIVYSILMTVFSKSFRNRIKLNDVWMITLFFILAIIISTMLFFNVHCAVQGAYNTPFCGIYAWITIIILALVVFTFIGQSIYFHIKDEKMGEEDRRP